MKKLAVGLSEIWDVNDLVEQVVADMRLTGYLYDENGDCIDLHLTEEVRTALIQNHLDHEEKDPFNFVSNPVLCKISFLEALEMELSDIFQNYLSKSDLKKVRGILRKDSRLNYGMVISDEVSDDILNQMIAIRWKDNLKLWALQREHANKTGKKG